jgi:hypothetical protein
MGFGNASDSTNRTDGRPRAGEGSSPAIPVGLMTGRGEQVGALSLQKLAAPLVDKLVPMASPPEQVQRLTGSVVRMPGQVTGRSGPRRRSGPEVIVDLADRHRPLADRGGHPFDRAATHVSRREHTGLAGLQHHRLTLRSHLIAIGV